MIKEPSLLELEEIRKQGFKPGVVACLVKERKVLFTFVSEYGLWQIPQGGIEVDETIRGALLRTIAKDLGEDIANHIDVNMMLIGEDRMEFPDSGGKRFESKSGSILMKGKHYYVVTTEVHGGEFDLQSSEVSIVRWVNFEEGMSLASSIYQKGKRRVTESILRLLKEGDFIS